MKQFLLDPRLEEFLAGKDIYVSLSGGSDSLALCVMLHNYSSKGLFKSFQAVHFEHGFRGKDSLDDAGYVKNFCMARGIKFILRHLDVPANRIKGEADEEAARRLRFQQWRNITAGNPDAVITLGHNSADRTENYLLRAMRGSNASGLSAMRKIQNLDGMILARPLLAFTKKEIEDFLLRQGISDWRHDSTNSENTYSRNFLRNEILPAVYAKIPFAEKGFSSSLAALELDAIYIEQQAEKAFRELPENEWKTLHISLLVRVMRLYISSELEQEFIPDSKFMARLLEALALESTEPILIPLKNSDAFLGVAKDTLKIHRPPLPEQQTAWHFRIQPDAEFSGAHFHAELVNTGDSLPQSDRNHVIFDADGMPDTLIIAQYLPGDRMTPFGADSAKKIKKIFTDSKVSSLDRENFPIVKAPDGTVLWIAGLRRSAFAPVTEKTKITVLISFTRPE